MNDGLSGLGCQPAHWTLCFERRASRWWLNWIPGRTKHVRAFGYVPLQGVWLFVEFAFCGLVVKAARDGSAAADALIRAWIADCDLLTVPHRTRTHVLPGFYCVGAVKRLCGIRSGALRPDGLWRDLVRQGATPFDEILGPDAAGPAAASAARPGA